MSIGPILASAGAPPIASLPPPSGDLNPANGDNAAKPPANPSEVARQFEAILVRQILSESMKSLLENGKDGQVYGYFITEALADGITKGGGLGLRSVLETQLRQSTGPRPDSGAAVSGTPAQSLEQASAQTVGQASAQTVGQASAQKGYAKRSNR